MGVHYRSPSSGDRGDHGAALLPEKKSLAPKKNHMSASGFILPRYISSSNRGLDKHRTFPKDAENVSENELESHPNLADLSAIISDDDPGDKLLLAEKILNEDMKRGRPRERTVPSSIKRDTGYYGSRTLRISCMGECGARL